MRNLSRIDIITAGLNRAAGTAGLLAAAWEALEFLRAATGGGPGLGLGPQWYAAYMCAAAAAAEARDAAGMAPSMPASDAPGTGPTVAGDEPPARLAGLAATLAGRLDAAAGHAELAGDREALRLAAAGAAQVRQLLASDG